MKSNTSIPLSLYIHMPWCVQKCPYCDFNSHAMGSGFAEEDYINAALADLKLDADKVHGRVLQTIFIGGGTPSLFRPDSIAALLNGVHEILPLTHDMEITMEANPGTLEQSRLAGFRAAGINRLSLGVQSFQDDKLKRLGRIHSSRDASSAIQQAQAVGFPAINIDLMFGLPDQTLEDAISDLQTAIQLSPTHMSWYQLTLEPNTVFYRHPPVLPKDELIFDMQMSGQKLLEQHGFSQYEISAYARKDFQCRHNLNYWRFGDYLGIGAGSHGKITLADNQIMRTEKFKQPKRYLDAWREGTNYLSQQQIVSQNDIAFEYMLNHLRLNETVTKAHFEKHTPITWDAITPLLDKAKHLGFIDYDQQQLSKTPQGALFLNDLQTIFLPDH